jgi:hypothetical protein
MVRDKWLKIKPLEGLGGAKRRICDRRARRHPGHLTTDRLHGCNESNAQDAYDPCVQSADDRSRETGRADKCLPRSDDIVGYVFAGIIEIGAVALCVIKLMELIRRRLLVWHQESLREETTV